MTVRLIITAADFERATGFLPTQDDLDRCNCPLAGTPGHWFCGWDHDLRLPVFMSPFPVRKRKP